jgi:two-component system chemotaxis response regulator CheB
MAHLQKDILIPEGRHFQAVVLGSSAGGIEILLELLSALPPGTPQAVLVVQHLPPELDPPLSDFLARRCRIPISEAQDKDDIEPGRVYVAPPNYHLLVESPGVVALSVDPKVNHSRPSIDVLFESAARVYGPRLVAMVLTGANHDGAAGLAAVKRSGGFCAVQDPKDAQHPDMPRAALAACEPDAVLPSSGLAALLARLPGPATASAPEPGPDVDAGRSFP